MVSNHKVATGAERSDRVRTLRPFDFKLYSNSSMFISELKARSKILSFLVKLNEKFDFELNKVSLKLTSSKFTL